MPRSFDIFKEIEGTLNSNSPENNIELFATTLNELLEDIRNGEFLDEDLHETTTQIMNILNVIRGVVGTEDAAIQAIAHNIRDRLNSLDDNDNTPQELEYINIIFRFTDEFGGSEEEVEEDDMFQLEDYCDDTGNSSATQTSPASVVPASVAHNMVTYVSGHNDPFLEASGGNVYEAMQRIRSDSHTDPSKMSGGIYSGIEWGSQGDNSW